jgi:ribose 1,5-bisphosphokinase
MRVGRLFFVVGPSGAGKDTLIAGAVAADPALVWARRCITRPEAAGTEPFIGLDVATFEARLQRGDFALHWNAHGLRYGVPHSEFAPLARGQNVLVNGSRGAIRQAQSAFPDLRVITITAPLAVLAQRLAARGRESADDIAARLQSAGFDLPAGIHACDVVNDGAPAQGVARLLAAIKG